MNHQEVDIVAFGTHHLGEVDGTEEHEAVEAEEVALEAGVVDVEEGDGQREEGDEAHTLDESATDGLVAHGALDFQLQVFANLSEAVQRLELRHVFQLGLLLFADFIVDERHLHATIDSKQDGEKDSEDAERPPREDGKVTDEIEDCVHLAVGEYEERYYQRTIESCRQCPPPHALIDERAHQQVPLAVDHHHQMQQTEHTDSRPSRHSTTPHDEGVG